jgi:ATP-binding cassette subfamily B protein
MVETSIIVTKLHRFLGQLPYIPRTIHLLIAAAPAYAAAWLGVLALQGVFPAVVVILGRKVVDAVSAEFRAGARHDIAHIVGIGGLLAAALLVTELLGSVATWVRAAQSELLTDHLYGLIHRKSASVDLAFYDSAEFYDHLHRARWEATYRPIGLIDSLGSILQNGLTLACMLFVLLRFGFWFPAALALSTVPALWVVLDTNLRQHHWRHRAAKEERRAWYYDWILTDNATACELRLFGLADHFATRFQNLRTHLRQERLSLVRRQFWSDLGASSMILAVSSVLLLVMLRRAALGTLTLGELVLFFGAFQQGLRMGRALLENVGQVYINSLFLENLFDFLGLRAEIVSPTAPLDPPQLLERGIECRKVRFDYPGGRQHVLEDFDLWIPAGKLTAIVGSNGSGKSTLLKLLCRFYDPVAGEILLDGVDLRKFSVPELRRRFAILFQDPVRYNTTVEENITLGALPVVPTRDEIADAARASGTDETIARLPTGYDTVLGKQFETGTDLSVGEWQRLALARAFVRRAPIIILDEPTSAMDPWAEAEWLRRFRQLAAERTSVMITHRFTTAMAADLVYVMRHGRVVESGTHAELLERKGLYREGWDAQMKSGPPLRG